VEPRLHILFEITEVENRTILRGKLKIIVTPTTIIYFASVLVTVVLHQLDVQNAWNFTAYNWFGSAEYIATYDFVLFAYVE